MRAAAYTRVRDMLAGNPDAGTACYQRVDGYSSVGGVFTLTGDCSLAGAFGHPVEICAPYLVLQYSGRNKDAIDAFLQFLLDAQDSDDESHWYC